MGNTYTISKVEDRVRDWQTKNGAAWKSYRVTLRNRDGREKENVELSRNATAPAPKPGETVEGTVDTSGQYGPKLVEARKGGGGGGFRGKPVEERRSIAMQNSHAHGVEIVRIAYQHGKRPDDVAAEAMKVAWMFYKRVQEAEGGAT